MPEQFNKSFEIMRHGEKDPQGGLSEKGVEGIRKYVREDLIHQIENYPDGTVIVFFPSNVGRAKDTRTVFEDELGSLFEQDPEHYDTVNIQDVERIKDFSGDKTKKLLIKNAGHQTLIGYKGARVDPWIDEFSRRGKDFEGSDDMTGKLWLATEEEMKDLNKEIAEKYPNVDQSDLKPSNFHDTPEHEAAEQIKWMLRLMEIANKHFPENPVKIFATSHNVLTDFAAIKLLDMPLTRASLEELGGNVRGFLEPHHVDIQGNKVVIRFRDKVNEFDASRLKTVLQELKQESEIREKMWTHMDTDITKQSTEYHRAEKSWGLEEKQKGQAPTKEQTILHSIFVEDNPVAIAKGKEIFEHSQQLEEENKSEEALVALNEDELAVAAYLAWQEQKRVGGGVHFIITPVPKEERKELRKRLLPNLLGKMSGQELLKQYLRSFPERIYTEREAKKREKRKQQLKEEDEFFQQHKGDLVAAIDFYNQRRQGKRGLLEREKGDYRPRESEGLGWKADARRVDSYRRLFTIKCVAELFDVDYSTLLKAVKKKPKNTK